MGMKNLKRGRVIYPKSIGQYAEEEFKKSADFRKAYSQETANLQIGYKIAQLRKMRHLSQAQLARRIHSTQQTISRLEELKNISVNIRTLIKVASALKAKLDIDFIPREITSQYKF